MQTYEELEMEIFVFDEDDIISTSVPTGESSGEGSDEGDIDFDRKICPPHQP